MRRLSNAREAEEWLTKEAAPGERAVYHEGASLAADRLADPVVDELATYLLEHSDTPVIQVTSACWHVRAEVVPSGELRLTQARKEPGGPLFYVAIRR